MNQRQDELSDQVIQVDRRSAVTAEEVLEEDLDDKMNGVKIEMEDFIKDELRDVEESWIILRPGHGIHHL
jgi:hypothetical protein